MTQPVLSVRDLTITFRTREGPAKVVDRMSYDLGPGETLAIVGESGSGKSVSSLALMQLPTHASDKHSQDKPGRRAQRNKCRDRNRHRFSSPHEFSTFRASLVELQPRHVVAALQALSCSAKLCPP